MSVYIFAPTLIRFNFVATSTTDKGAAYLKIKRVANKFYRENVILFNFAKSLHVYTFDEAINYWSAEKISHYTGFLRAGKRHGSTAAAETRT